MAGRLFRHVIEGRTLNVSKELTYPNTFRSTLPLLAVLVQLEVSIYRRGLSELDIARDPEVLK